MEKNDSVAKLITLSLIGLVILWILENVLVPFGTGVNFRVNFGGDHMNMGYGYGYGAGGTLTLILMLLIKVLFVVFVVGLVVGIVIAVKNYVFTAEDVATIKGAFKFNKSQVKKETCSLCGKEIEAEWKVCPYCGKEKLEA